MRRRGDSRGPCGEPHRGVPTFNETSRGSHKWVYLRVHPGIREAIAFLKKKGFRIYAIALREEAQDFRKVDCTKPTAILLGAEKWGFPRKPWPLPMGP